MTNEEFIAFLVPYAQQGQKDYGVYASVTIAQACWESGWGRYQGTVVQVDKNIFGIKYHGNHASGISVTQGTRATDDGGYYARYNSWGDSCIDHGYFLRNNSRYPNGGCFDDGISADEQIKRIMDCGYAGTRYDKQAIQIMVANNLYQYDNGGTGGGGGGGDTPPIEDTGIVGKVVTCKTRYKYCKEDSLFGSRFSTNKIHFFVYSCFGNKATIIPSTIKDDIKIEEVDTGKVDENGDSIIEEVEKEIKVIEVTTKKINVNKRHLKLYDEEIDNLKDIPYYGKTDE